MQTYLPLDARLDDIVAALSPTLRNEQWEAPPNFTWERVVTLPVPEPPAPREDNEFAYRDRSWVDVKIHSAPGGIVLLAAGYLLAHSNSSGILVVIKDATGTVIRAFNLPTPATVKMDCLDGDHQGRHYAFAIGGHEPVSTEQRLNVVYVAVLTDVLPPYPGGQAPEGAAVDPRTYGGGEPMPASFTLDDLIARLVVELQSPNRAGIGKLTQKLAQNGATDALAAHPLTLPANVLTTENMGAAYAASAEVAGQLDNRAGVQVWKGLLVSGLVPLSKAPEWIKTEPGYPWGAV